jgi:hypothetical protein
LNVIEAHAAEAERPAYAVAAPSRVRRTFVLAAAAPEKKTTALAAGRYKALSDVRALAPRIKILAEPTPRKPLAKQIALHAKSGKQIALKSAPGTRIASQTAERQKSGSRGSGATRLASTKVAAKPGAQKAAVKVAAAKPVAKPAANKRIKVAAAR